MSSNDVLAGAMRKSGSGLRPSRAALIALWATQVTLAVMFVMAGGTTLAGVPAMVSLFEAVGVGQWLR